MEEKRPSNLYRSSNKAKFHYWFYCFLFSLAGDPMHWLLFFQGHVRLLAKDSWSQIILFSLARWKLSEMRDANKIIKCSRWLITLLVVEKLDFRSTEKTSVHFYVVDEQQFVLRTSKYSLEYLLLFTNRISSRSSSIVIGQEQYFARSNVCQ